MYMFRMKFNIKLFYYLFNHFFIQENFKHTLPGPLSIWTMAGIHEHVILPYSVYFYNDVTKTNIVKYNHWLILLKCYIAANMSV